jgi:CRISPR system Cascade subunit CasB
MSKAEEQADRLMAFLHRNKEDRGVMADLRCGFSPAKEHRAWPHIAQLCRLELPWSRIPVQTVCAAFATHSDNAKTGNMGTAMQKIAGKNKDGLASFEKRFQRLLSCDTKEELCDHLPAVVRMAKAKGIPVNYRQMYCDICWWEVSDIKVRWASSFWGVAGGEE